MRTRLIALVAALVLAWAGPVRAEEGPRELVTRFLTAIQNHDYAGIARTFGYDVPAEANAMVAMFLESPRHFTWQLKNFKILDVRRDGGLAVVMVEETDFRDFSPEIRKAIEEKVPGLAHGLIFGDARVTERFVLVRLDGRWQFDSGHSGIDMHPLLDAFQKAMRPGAQASEAQLYGGLANLINGVGFGQIVQSLAGSVALAPVGAAIVIPNFIRARSQGQLTACKSDLKNIGTALEMYSTDYSGRYPTSLSLLTPNYLKMIPTCPAAGADTYSASYQVNAKGDGFTVFCSGAHHRAVGIPADFPQYTSTQGLLDGR
jgi:hypothetical protein